MFSIIMPAYNAENTIIESINSVIKQTFTDFELLIIDDCSQDETTNIIEKFQAEDPRIKLLKNEKNSGVALTRNKGISAAENAYICFLDSDDLWHPNKLFEFHQYFMQGHAILFSYYTRFNDKQKINLVKAPEQINYTTLLKGNCIGNLTGAYNSKKLGKFYQKKVRHEDYLMWLEILRIGKTASCIPKNLAYYRVSNNSLSGNKFRSLYWTWCIYNQELHLNKIQSMYFIIHSICRAFYKRFNKIKNSNL